MKAMIQGNPYKYWIRGGDIKLHLFDSNADWPRASVVTPNDICEDFTYANQAYGILSCCGTGSVELHYYLEDEDDIQYINKFLDKRFTKDCEMFWNACMATFVPSRDIDRDTFECLLVELYDVDPLEIWDGQTNTGKLDLA